MNSLGPRVLRPPSAHLHDTGPGRWLRTGRPGQHVKVTILCEQEAVRVTGRWEARLGEQSSGREDGQASERVWPFLSLGGLTALEDHRIMEELV